MPAKDMMSDQTILVTGAAGFIGFHIARQLLAEGRDVIGLDNLNDYYDPALKQARLNVLRENSKFSFVQADLADRPVMAALFARHRFAVVVHLAAQPGGIRSNIPRFTSTPISKALPTFWKDAGTMNAVIWCMHRRRRFTAPTQSCRFRLEI
jgi:hypothetical protein